MSGRKGVDPVVRKETVRVGAIAYAGIALMLLGFFLLHTFCPKEVLDVPFDYTVILAGVCCGIIDILNFFLMGLAVVKVTSLEPVTDEEGNVSDEDKGKARKIMSTSMRLRFLMMIVWVILAIALPCFDPVAGIMPLIVPSLGIKLLGIAKKDDPVPAAQDATDETETPGEREIPEGLEVPEEQDAPDEANDPEEPEA